MIFCYYVVIVSQDSDDGFLKFENGKSDKGGEQGSKPATSAAASAASKPKTKRPVYRDDDSEDDDDFDAGE